MAILEEVSLRNKFYLYNNILYLVKYQPILPALVNNGLDKGRVFVNSFLNLHIYLCFNEKGR